MRREHKQSNNRTPRTPQTPHIKQAVMALSSSQTELLIGEHRHKEIRELIAQALDVLRGGHRDATEEADRLLSGPEWLGIQRIQEDAKRLNRYEGRSLWQTLIYLMESIVTREITSIETSLDDPTCKGARRNFFQYRLTLINRYVIEGVSERTLGSELARDKSSISRDKKKLYAQLTDCALAIMRNEKLASLYIADTAP